MADTQLQVPLDLSDEVSIHKFLDIVIRRLLQAETDLTTVKADVTTLENNYTLLEDRVTALETNYTLLEARVTTLEP